MLTKFVVSRSTHNPISDQGVFQAGKSAFLSTFLQFSNKIMKRLSILLVVGEELIT